jgi:hypothetical protein
MRDQQRIQDMRFKTEDSRTLRTSHPDVLNQLAVPATWPEWQSEIVSTSGPERVQVGDVVSGEASMLGFEVAGRATTVEVSDDAVEQDVLVGVRMRVRYILTSTSEGIRITHRLTADLPRGFAGRILSFFLQRRFKSMQQELLDNLVNRLSVSARSPNSEVAMARDLAVALAEDPFTR